MDLDIKWVGCHSTNFAKGRVSRSGVRYKPEAIVVHVMAGTLVGTDAHFLKKRPGWASSAGYGIGTPWKQPGKLAIHQYVKDEDTAFHTGVVARPTWKLMKPGGVSPNLYTLSIEHEGTASSKWSEAMYGLSARLIRELCAKWSIPVTRDYIVGHREIYAVKPCPGKCDLGYLVRLAAAL